jgi:Ca2+-binding RTX toxin-like protein
MVAGETLTIGGLVYTSTAASTAAEVAAAFAGLANAAATGGGTTTGSYSGALTGFSSSAAIGHSVLFTSTTANSNVTNLIISNNLSGTAQPVTVLTEVAFTVKVHPYINVVKLIDGTDAADALAGTGSGDLMLGGIGNDTLTAGGGNDTLIGGVGNDSLVGGVGIDTLDYSEAEAPLTITLGLLGAPGSAVDASTGAGSLGTDVLLGLENVIGGRGADSISGNEDFNLLDGGEGADTLSGGGGKDTLLGGQATIH